MYERTKERYTGALLNEMRSAAPLATCQTLVIPISLVDLLNQSDRCSEWAPRIEANSAAFQASTGADMAATQT